MKFNQSSLQLGVAILAGFLGGALSNHVWVGDPAQAKAQPPQAITARSFQIVDNQGKKRIEIGVYGDKQNPGLVFFDAEGKEPIGGIGFDGNQEGHLLLKGPQGKSLVDLKVEDGGATLTMSNQNARSGLELNLSSSGNSRISLANRDRDQEVRIDIDEDRSAIAVLQDGEKAGVGFVVGPTVDPAVLILKDHMPRTVLGSTDVLSKMPDKVGYHEQRGADSLVFLNEKGQLRWKAP